MIHTTLKSWKNRKLINESVNKINENYDFDFEDWDDTDIAGMAVEGSIRDLIDTVIDDVNREVEDASGYAIDKEELKLQARTAIADLWKEKIDEYLVTGIKFNETKIATNENIRLNDSIYDTIWSLYNYKDLYDLDIRHGNIANFKITDDIKNKIMPEILKFDKNDKEQKRLITYIFNTIKENQ